MSVADTGAGIGPDEEPLAGIVARLRAERDGLRRAIRSRAVIEQAKGVVMAPLAVLSADETAEQRKRQARWDAIPHADSDGHHRGDDTGDVAVATTRPGSDTELRGDARRHVRPEQQVSQSGGSRQEQSSLPDADARNARSARQERTAVVGAG